MKLKYIAYALLLMPYAVSTAFAAKSSPTDPTVDCNGVPLWDRFVVNESDRNYKDAKYEKGCYQFKPVGENQNARGAGAPVAAPSADQRAMYGVWDPNAKFGTAPVVVATAKDSGDGVLYEPFDSNKPGVAVDSPKSTADSQSAFTKDTADKQSKAESPKQKGETSKTKVAAAKPTKPAAKTPAKLAAAKPVVVPPKPARPKPASATPSVPDGCVMIVVGSEEERQRLLAEQKAGKLNAGATIVNSSNPVGAAMAADAAGGNNRTGAASSVAIARALSVNVDDYCSDKNPAVKGKLPRGYVLMPGAPSQMCCVKK